MSAPASHLDPYIATWNRIHKQSVRLMRAAPDEQYGWKPSESAMTLGELMNHLYLAEAGIVEAALTGQFPRTHPEAIMKTEELIAAFDASHEEQVKRVAALTPEQLAEIVTPFGEKAGPMPRQVVLQALHEHEIHHRGQLYTYLRILGCEVPPLFG
jgi:uncharacterized damage-inducible protein DinB